MGEMEARLSFLSLYDKTPAEVSLHRGLLSIHQGRVPRMTFSGSVESIAWRRERRWQILEEEGSIGHQDQDGRSDHPELE